ncbi:site-specific integrase [Dubosiella newyorkensis]|uniref:Site-specific integrase n=1 Tax=Dubosiella newyorkensis TaxID=1862672 RepID=A0A1U7NMV7_9FIRM|nr:site-specific integrase [Dubosiella newyorkensis]OLU46627.1 hypothetical protein BO225_05500 [Dubosiella newyorkensis]
MPVYKDEKRGTWYVDIHYTDQNGKSRHITRRGFKRKGDAKAAEEDILRNLADNLPSSMTLDELVDQFNKNYAIEGIKESTMISNYSVYKQHIHKQLGSTKVKSIKAKTVMDWMSDLIAKEKPDGKKYSENTINNTKMTLSTYLSYAVKLEILESNPCHKVKKYKDQSHMSPKTDAEINFWSQTEFNKFYDAIDDTFWKTVFSFLWETGVRRGELISLQWQDIEFEKRTIMIRSTATNKTSKKGIIRTSPKTKRSNRRIDMTSSLEAALLDRFRNEQTKDGFCSNWYVFGDFRALSPTTLKRKHDQYTEAANVKHITLHGFRHSHASIMIMNGMPDQLVADRLGHSVETLHKVYTHIYEEQRVSFKEALNKIYNINSSQLPHDCFLG